VRNELRCKSKSAKHIRSTKRYRRLPRHKTNRLISSFKQPPINLLLAAKLEQFQGNTLLHSSKALRGQKMRPLTRRLAVNQFLLAKTLEEILPHQRTTKWVTFYSLENHRLNKSITPDKNCHSKMSTRLKSRLIKTIKLKQSIKTNSLTHFTIELISPLSHRKLTPQAQLTHVDLKLLRR